jgi:alpha-tubulin suppressor-like RCC1 family protein
VAGRIYCWGQNVYGQLGIGNTVNKLAPVEVVGGAKWLQDNVTVGGHHVCANSASPFQTYCWGSNNHGQLGVGGTVNRSSPVVIPVTVQPIVAGGEFTCGRWTGGTNYMYCWGRGDLGSLGNGFFTDQHVPNAIGNFTYSSDPSALAAGAYHVIAKRTDGSVVAWGYNNFGQLGNGTTDTKPAPIVILAP